MPRKRPISTVLLRTLTELEHRQPVGMLNVCKGLVKYWDKGADPAKDLAKAHLAIAKAAGGVG
jgi:hypothetical protein